jgi:hypothetical protein
MIFNKPHHSVIPVKVRVAQSRVLGIISIPLQREEISIYKEIPRPRPSVVARNDKKNSSVTDTFAEMTSLFEIFL